MTTLNQCLLRGKVTVGQDKSAPMTANGRKEYPALSWAWHDDIGYAFPTPAKVTLGEAPQKGSWKAVYSAGSAELETKDVFAMRLDHGTKPQQAAYAYVILPSVSAEQVRTYAARPDLEILSNTAVIQAAKCGGLAMVVLYQPGQLAYASGKQIAVDQPCLVMVQETNEGPKLTVTDPTQKLEMVNVTLNGNAVKIQLPQGPNAGSSIGSRQ